MAENDAGWSLPVRQAFKPDSQVSLERLTYMWPDTPSAKGWHTTGRRRK